VLKQMEGLLFMVLHLSPRLKVVVCHGRLSRTYADPVSRRIDRTDDLDGPIRGFLCGRRPSPPCARRGPSALADSINGGRSPLSSSL
jgi:hypothetical protein